jgi:NADH-quinone oxidoreductase subunit L
VSFEAWLIWLVPLVGAVLVPAVEKVDGKFCSWYAIGLTGASALLSLHQALTFVGPSVGTLGGWSLFGSVQAEVYVDGLSVFMALFVSSLSLAILVYSAGIMSRESGQGRFYTLMLVFIGSMVGLVMAGNLVQFYLLWELLGICSALLIAFWWDREPARRAGLKAFLVTRVGDIALLIGVVLVLSSLHTTDISSVLSAAASPQGKVNWDAIGLLVLVGAMGKSAQVPLHAWLPDAMEGPTPVSALIHAATMVNAGVFLLVRLAPIYAASSILSNSVLAVGVASLLVGGACATAATDIKRVLAYSTISQLGLMFIAVGLGSVSGAVYLLVSAGIIKALAFMAAGSVAEATGTRDVLKMGGLRREMKLTYYGFLTSALAMAGLPPFFGFWTKELVSASELSAGAWVFLVVLLGSALTTFYVFRVIFRVFLGQPTKSGLHDPRGLMVGPMIALSVVAAMGWIGAALQTLFVPALSLSLEFPAAAVSVAVISSALIVCYTAFVAKPQSVLGFASSSSLASKLISALNAGIWFDSAYSTLANRVFVPLTRLASRIQTGDLGDNIAIFLAALVATFLIVVLVVG